MSLFPALSDAFKIETEQGQLLWESRVGFEGKINVTQLSITVGEPL